MMKDSKGLKIILLVLVIVGALLWFNPAGCSLLGRNTLSGESEGTISNLNNMKNIEISAVSSRVSVISDPAAKEISAELVGTKGQSVDSLETYVEGDTLFIKVKNPDQKIWDIFRQGIKNRNLEVRIPESFLNTKLENLKAVTVSGSIDLGSLTAQEDIDLTTTSGSIEFVNLQAGKELKIGSVSGSISGDSVTAEDVEIHTISGTIDVYYATADNLDMKSTSAGLELQEARVKKEASFHSISGEIDVSFDNGDNIDVKASTISGDIRLNGERYDKKAEFKSGNESLEVKAETTSGDITLYWK